MADTYEFIEKKPTLALFFGVAAAENLPLSLLMWEFDDSKLLNFILAGAQLSTVAAIMTWASIILAIIAIVFSTSSMKKKVRSRSFCVWGLVLSIIALIIDLTVMPVVVLMISCGESC